MRVLHLRLSNFSCFKEVELDFPPGAVAIVGPNGHGKSSIVEGIAWVLFGNCIDRFKKGGVKRAGAAVGEQVRGKVVFVHEGMEYVLERKLKGKNLTIDVTLSSEGNVLASGNKAVRDAVEDVLGMDWTSFETSVFTRQKELALFSSLQGAERKARMLKIMRIELIDRSIESVRKDIRGRSSDIKQRRAVMESRKPLELLERERGAWERRKEETKKRIGNERDFLKRSEGEVERLERETEFLDKKAEEYEGVEEALREKEVEMAAKRERLRRVVKSWEELEEKERILDAMGDVENKLREVQEKAKSMEKERELFSRYREGKRRLETMRANRMALEREVGKLEKMDYDSSLLREAERELQEIRGERMKVIEGAATLRREKKGIEEKTEEIAGHIRHIEELGGSASCPTCLRPLGEHREETLIELTAALKNATERVKAIRKQLETMNTKMKRLDKTEKAVRDNVERFRAEERRAAARKERIRGLRERIMQMVEEMHVIERDIADLPFSFDEEGYRALDNERQRLEGLVEEKKRMASELERLRIEAEEQGRLKTEVEILEREVKDLKRVEMTAKENGRLLESAREALSAARVDTARAEAKLKELRSEMRHIEREVERLEKDVTLLHEEESMVRELTVELDMLRRVEGLLLGFKNYIVGKIGPRLTDMASELLSNMTGGNYSEIRMTEDYGLELFTGGEYVPLKRFSGGEQDLANLALRLAISQLVSEVHGSGAIGFVILDEVFSSLDGEYLKECLEALGKLETRFEQIFVVTHQEEIRDRMRQIILVNSGKVVADY